MKKYIILLWLALIANVVQGQQLVRQVQTLADLANVADGFQSLYNVQYGYTEGDGLGGVFFYDSNGAASTNIFNVIDSNIIAGQWVRSETTQKELRLGDASGSPYTGFQAPTTLGGNVVYTMPTTDGAAGQVLSTDGSLVLSWDNAATLASDDLGQIAGTKLIGPALYFDGSNDEVTIADDNKLTFSSSAEFGTNSSGTWSPDDNTPALTDGTGTLNQHYRVDAGAGTVTQGASTLSIINGTATTAGQAVYYDGSVWRLKDVDDLPFSISAWVKILDVDGCRIVGKYAASNTHREYNFGTAPTTGKLRLQLRDSSGYSPTLNSTDSMSGYVGQWVHVACSYAGSGPNSANAFSVALGSGCKLYINGVLDSTAVAADHAPYGGMSNTAQALTIGLSDNEYGNAEIRDVKIFNRELTATEVAELAKGNELGFADQYAGALGAVYTSDFSAGADGYAAINGAVAGNIDTIGGQDDNLRFTCDTTSGEHYAYKSVTLTSGKKYRVDFDVYISNLNSNIDGISIRNGLGSPAVLTPSADTWTRFSEELTSTYTGSISLRWQMYDGAVATFQDAGGNDLVYIRNVKVTEIGTLADFRAEQYDTNTNKLYDLSDNAFVGTGTSISLTGREIPVYETGTWTPSITFGGGATGITYTTQEGHYTRYGNWVSVHAYILLSAKGSDTGTALIAGLPFTARNTAASSHSLTVGNMSNAANLTSAVTAYATDNGTTINLVDWGATGIAVLDDTNFGATTSISVTGIYQIQ